MAALVAASIVLAAAIAAAGASLGAHPRGIVLPPLRAGETLHYRVEAHTAITGEITSPIANPAAPSRFDQNVTIIVRLQVLRAPAEPGGARSRGGNSAAAGDARLTFEDARSKSRENGYDPEAGRSDASFEALKGRSVELILDAHGRVTGVSGLAKAFADHPPDLQLVLAWIPSLTQAAALQGHVRVGKRWRREAPLAGMPLAGLYSREESRYLRNEPCAMPSAGTGFALPVSVRSPASASGECAAVLTRFQIRQRKPKSGETPPDFARNGLRTSGKWSGEGESLDSISLATGALVSSTQSSTEEMDYTVRNAVSGSSLHRQGRVQRTVDMELIP